MGPSSGRWGGQWGGGQDVAWKPSLRQAREGMHLGHKRELHGTTLGVQSNGKQDIHTQRSAVRVNPSNGNGIDAGNSVRVWDEDLPARGSLPPWVGQLKERGLRRWGVNYALETTRATKPRDPIFRNPRLSVYACGENNQVHLVALDDLFESHPWSKPPLNTRDFRKGWTIWRTS